MKVFPVTCPATVIAMHDDRVVVSTGPEYWMVEHLMGIFKPKENVQVGDEGILEYVSFSPYLCGWVFKRNNI
jgi:hypothetical protein